MSRVQIVAVVGNPRAESRTHGLARTLALELAHVLPGAAVGAVDLAALGPRVLDQDDPGAAAARAQALSADVLIVASPTYKATYSGLLKAFLDRFAAGSLSGKTAVPVLLGGAPNHQLAVDVHFTRCCWNWARPCPPAGCSCWNPRWTASLRSRRSGPRPTGQRSPPVRSAALRPPGRGWVDP